MIVSVRTKLTERHENWLIILYDQFIDYIGQNLIQIISNENVPDIS